MQSLFPLPPLLVFEHVVCTPGNAFYALVHSCTSFLHFLNLFWASLGVLRGQTWLCTQDLLLMMITSWWCWEDYMGYWGLILVGCMQGKCSICCSSTPASAPQFFGGGLFGPHLKSVSLLSKIAHGRFWGLYGMLKTEPRPGPGR